jgi:hypothetical protein
MRIQSLFLAGSMLSFSFSQGVVFADDAVMHQGAHTIQMSARSAAVSQGLPPEECYLTVVNEGFYNVNVYGVFDDLTSVYFPIPVRDSAHRIGLFYNNYCHAGMRIFIYSPNFVSPLADNYVQTRAVVRVNPYLKQESALTSTNEALPSVTVSKE